MHGGARDALVHVTDCPRGNPGEAAHPKMRQPNSVQRRRAQNATGRDDQPGARARCLLCRYSGRLARGHQTAAVCGERPRGPCDPDHGSLTVGSGTGVTGIGVDQPPRPGSLPLTQTCIRCRTGISLPTRRGRQRRKRDLRGRSHSPSRRHVADDRVGDGGVVPICRVRRGGLRSLSPRSERVRPGLGATAFVLAPARAGLSQWRHCGRAITWAGGLLPAAPSGRPGFGGRLM
jgi:hypothetical protein